MQLEGVSAVYYKCRWAIREAAMDILKRKDKLVVCEIGVYEGAHAETLLSLPLRGLVLVDKWSTLDEEHYSGHDQAYWDAMHQRVVARFAPHAQILRMTSLEASKYFPPCPTRSGFDIIYLDATHTFEACMEDLVAWWPQVKQGGYYCGDDWRYPGINKAVREFCVKRCLDFEYHENEWMIRKP
jgi:hypothetical protein